MTITWMLYAIVLGTVLSIAALLAEHGARAAGRPTRWAWFGALLLTGAWPVVALAARTPGGRSGSAIGAAVQVQTIVVGAAGTLETAVTRTGMHDVLPYAWAAVSILLVLRLLVGVVVVARHRRMWPRDEIDGTPVRISIAHGPAVVGVAPGEVVVPVWVRVLDPAARALVLAHEREHLAARDPLLLYAAALVRALFPWNPLLWWQSARLALAIETDCDRRVLARGADRARYARLLVEIAARQHAPLFAPALSAHAAHLERRILSMRITAPARSTRRAAMLAAVGGAIAGLACAAPMPAATLASPVLTTTVSGGGADTIPLLEKDVDKPVTPRSGNAAPVYPAELREAAVTGEVIIQFVVNTDGSIAPETIRVLKSSHGRFTDAVREVMPRWRFVPAEKGGKPVRQIVQMPFVFSLSK